MSPETGFETFFDFANSHFYSLVDAALDFRHRIHDLHGNGLDAFCEKSPAPESSLVVVRSPPDVRGLLMRLRAASARPCFREWVLQRSISFATVTPSFVIVGPPHFFPRTTVNLAFRSELSVTFVSAGECYSLP